MNNSTDFSFDIQSSNTTSFKNGSLQATPTKSWYQPSQLPLYMSQLIVINFGIITNIINVAVFSKLGLNDSVTVSFFSISVSDMIHLICFGVIRLLSILQFEHGIKSSVVRLQDLSGFFGWVSVYFMDVSMYITVFATFQKCCCVALPLMFKNFFTKTRSSIVILTIFTLTLIIFLPVFINILDNWLFDPLTKSHPLNWIKLNSSPAAIVWRWLHRIVLTISSQIFIILCLTIITTKLRQSLEFRLSNKQLEKYKENEGKENTWKIGQKELRAIQAVQLIALIFILATLPTTVNSLVSVLFPAINLPRYRNVVLTIQALIYFGGTINASVNIFVYLKYNTKYRTVFLNHFKLSMKRCRTNATTTNANVPE